MPFTEGVPGDEIMTSVARVAQVFTVSAAFIILVIACMFGFPAWGRYEDRRNAANAIHILQMVEQEQMKRQQQIVDCYSRRTCVVTYQ